MEGCCGFDCAVDCSGSFVEGVLLPELVDAPEKIT